MTLLPFRYSIVAVVLVVVMVVQCLLESNFYELSCVCEEYYSFFERNISCKSKTYKELMMVISSGVCYEFAYERALYHC
uniref:Uncharacterized protein n=1 Tax=Cannabis sativa TaxID=3483 RepID=A0A803R195_CANSA